MTKSFSAFKFYLFKKIMQTIWKREIIHIRNYFYTDGYNAGFACGLKVNLSQKVDNITKDWKMTKEIKEELRKAMTEILKIAAEKMYATSEANELVNKFFDGNLLDD